MKISEHFDKDNLHHAYLIEGEKENILPEVFSFVEEEIKIKTVGNPDFYHSVIDHFKINDAFNLRNMGSEKSFSDNKRIFVLCINRFTGDAQGVLLKLFEEPIENTHFFIITPSTDSLLKTFLSRFYLIKNKKNTEEEIKKAEMFLRMSLKDRLDFIKDKILISKEEKSEDSETSDMNYVESNQTRALKFLADIESIIVEQRKLSKDTNNFEIAGIEQIFKAREYIRQPGASAKMLLESVAIALAKSK